MSVLTCEQITVEINRAYAVTGMCPPFLYLNILDFAEFRKAQASRYASWSAPALGFEQMIFKTDLGNTVFQLDPSFPRGQIWAGPGTIADYYARKILLGDDSDDFNNR